MELKITNYNNFFKIKGVLNKKNLTLFEKEFTNIFDRLDNLKVSIEGVESMDRYGVLAITKLHKEALTRDKRLSIIGYGCKNLFEEFNTTASV